MNSVINARELIHYSEFANGYEACCTYCWQGENCPQNPYAPDIVWYDTPLVITDYPGEFTVELGYFPCQYCGKPIKIDLALINDTNTKA